MAAIQILDPNTNEWFSFEPVTTWYDGTPMTPAKADGGIYIEYPASSGNYYKRVYTGPERSKDEGNDLCASGNTAFDLWICCYYRC